LADRNAIAFAELARRTHDRPLVVGIETALDQIAHDDDRAIRELAALQKQRSVLK
jgi:hypothetical protein